MSSPSLQTLGSTLVARQARIGSTRFHGREQQGSRRVSQDVDSGDHGVLESSGETISEGTCNAGVTGSTPVGGSRFIKGFTVRPLYVRGRLANFDQRAGRCS
jgi:hypothetical protein